MVFTTTTSPSEFVVSVNGKPHTVPGKLGNLSLNEWIRTHAGVKSTKLGCGEGGCGACAVLISSTDPATGVSTWHSINSCLSPVYLAHGEDILTAEALPPVEEGRPSVTDRLASFHATQCGFCTPGMAVACHAALSKCRDKGVVPTQEVLRDALDGNLCRCTGYRPIVDACTSFAADVDIEDLGLCTYGKDEKAKLAARQVAPITRGPYQLPKGTLQSFELGEGQTLVVPYSLDQLVQELGKPGAHLVAGNTSPGIYKDWPTHPLLVSVNKVPELRSIQLQDSGTLVCGAAVTLARLADTLEEGGKKVQMWREMHAHVQRIAGSHVRNAATVGGNVVLTRTRNLPSDVSTLLLAAGGKAVFVGPSAAGADASKTRQVLSLDHFYDPSFTCPVLEALPSGGSVLVELSIPDVPAVPGATRFWSSRLAHRYANAVSDLNAALKLTLSPSGTVTSARVALGFDEGCTQGHLGVWHLTRLTSVEAALVGAAAVQLPGAELAEKVVRALAADLAPLLGPKLAAGEERARFISAAAEGFLRQALPALAHPDGQGAVNGTSATAAATAPGSAENGANGEAGVGAGAGVGACSHHALPCKLPKPAVVKGRQDFPPADPSVSPLTEPLMKTGALLQAKGMAVFTDDVTIAKDALFAAFVVATRARARVVSIDASKALQLPGVSAFVNATDIPGANLGCALWSVPFPGTQEPLFADEEVHYYGQPLGLVLADSYQLAVRAAKEVEVEYDSEGLQPVTTIKAALQAKSYFDLAQIMPMYPKGPSADGNSILVQSQGVDVEEALRAAPLVARNARYSLPAQTHLYMEPQSVVAEMEEDGAIKLVASCQGLEGTQHTVSKVLDLPLGKVNVSNRRMGGAYGGKISHVTKVAAAAAVAAHKTHKQVRLAVERCTDFSMFGGRMETEVEYSVGCDADGLILALDLKVTLQGGAYQDISFMDVFVMTSPETVYFIPAVRAEFTQVRTNAPPRTTVRGPGETQVQMIMENVIEHVAALTGLQPQLVRERNMMHARSGEARQRAAAAAAAGKGNGVVEEGVLVNGCGRKVRESTYSLDRIWGQLKEQVGYDKLLGQVDDFNAHNRYRKRGLSMVPCKYSLSGGRKAALVSVHPDGSVVVAHGGTEMGQGLVTKVVQTVASTLSQALEEGAPPFPVALIRTTDPSTLAVPFFSVTGGSTTSEGACEAVRAACGQLVERLAPLARSKREAGGKVLTWQQLAAAAHAGQMPFNGMTPPMTMTAYAEAQLGEGGGYTTYGAAVVVAEVDALTGDRQVVSVDLLFDAGKTLNPAVDIGQVEGAFTHGMGAFLTESFELHPSDGSPASATTWRYKVPGVYCAPQALHVSLLRDSPLHLQGPISCKAVGEPPLLLASGVLLALQQAAMAAKADRHGVAQGQGETNGHKGAGYKPLCAPATPEAIRTYLST